MRRKPENFDGALRRISFCGILMFSFFLLRSEEIFVGDSNVTAPRFVRPDYYIDDDQKRIDGLDGVVDGEIYLEDSADRVYAGKVFFKEIDSLQRLIDRPEFKESNRKVYRDLVYLALRRVNGYTVYNVKRFDMLFRFIAAELNGIISGKLYPHLISNVPLAFRTFMIFKNESCADSFLLYACRINPEQVLKIFDNYREKSYAQRVVEEATKADPANAKRYFNKGDSIYEKLKRSEDPAIKTVMKIKDKYMRKSNAFVLLDDIMLGKMTIDEANSVGENPRKYLRAMLRIRARQKPLAQFSLEKDLATYALKFVRVLNDLHNEKDEKRFESIEEFSAEELYTLIVYSEEEIFTSSFNGLYKRMMIKTGDRSGFEFLESLGDNRFRTFIKMSAGFGKLKDFLESMSPLHQQLLMVKFASDLEKYNDLSQAVEVADAFASIKDSLVLRILRDAIKYEYVRLKMAKNTRGTTIYGLLSNLFVDRKISDSTWFTSVSNQYKLAAFDKIPNGKLLDRDSVNHWLIYFYDDEDGDYSFSSFIKTFTDSLWRIDDDSAYVVVKSKTGVPVIIYANKPKHEYDGQAKLDKIFTDGGIEPNVIVHRGHSYYAYKTIEKINDNTQVFVLGSCGGYHSISSIIELSPEISIISSKQIGTMFVNNPMLKLMADNIREGKDMEWQPLWDALLEKIKKDPKAYERYLDYIPPHKNLGAIFIKTYNKLMEES